MIRFILILLWLPLTGLAENGGISATFTWQENEDTLAQSAQPSANKDTVCICDSIPDHEVDSFASASRYQPSGGRIKRQGFSQRLISERQKLRYRLWGNHKITAGLTRMKQYGISCYKW